MEMPLQGGKEILKRPKFEANYSKRIFTHKQWLARFEQQKRRKTKKWILQN